MSISCSVALSGTGNRLLRLSVIGFSAAAASSGLMSALATVLGLGLTFFRVGLVTLPFCDSSGFFCLGKATGCSSATL